MMAGFDTHSEQLHRHHQALDKLARALAEFWQGLEQRGWADSTTVMVFSEFGRRVEESRSSSTDHARRGRSFSWASRFGEAGWGSIPA